MTEGFDMNALLAQAQQMQEQMLAARDNLAARNMPQRGARTMLTMAMK